MTDLIGLLNHNNSYFTVEHYPSPGLPYKIQHHSDDQLVNEITSNIVLEVLTDSENQSGFQPHMYQKYTNWYCRLFHLAEAISNLGFLQTNETYSTQSVAYLHLMMDKLQHLLYQFNRPNSTPINPCVSCGEDMGANNPRQLCGKTYCRNEKINILD